MVPTITPLRFAGRAPRVLTIDVEDWFHVCGDGYYSDPRRWASFPGRVEKTLSGLLELLHRGEHRATFFFLGWVAGRYPDLVRETAHRGHEVGVHGDLHRRVDEMSPAEFRDDLRRAREKVEAAGGGSAAVYRAAEWSIRHPAEPALATLAREGFRCDASMTAVPPLGLRHNPIGPHRIDFGGRTITEVPPLTGRAYGRRLPLGGGWPFRLLGERRLQGAEEEFRAAGYPAVFTFHPWELDREHPPMDGLPALTRVVHFAGLRSFPERLERWLAQDRSVPLEDALAGLSAA
jgi:polysaccharide deacetylase family protein (PEP-CTERM system associated)